ncbi:MAG: hypothetical protein ACLU5J_10205 [Christensenellales bacterium]
MTNQSIMIIIKNKKMRIIWNIYEDYANYISECQELIEEMIQYNSSVYYAIADVLKVTDYIYQKNEKKETIDEDMLEIFEIGYGYLANVLGDLKTYYLDYFDKNIEVFNYYSGLMLYSIYIEDYKSHLNVQDLINDDIEKNLTDLIYKIDGILVNKKPYDKNTITDIEAKVSENKPQNDNYKPVYNVFRLIVEELDLE